VICQALIPSLKGDSYYLATECLTPNAEAQALIASRNVGGIRPLLDKLNAVPDSRSHTMNSDLQILLKAKRVGLADARKATTDLARFHELFER